MLVSAAAAAAAVDFRREKKVVNSQYFSGVHVEGAPVMLCVISAQMLPGYEHHNLSLR